MTKHYYEVKGAVQNAELWDNRFHDYDDELLACYEDYIPLGWFESDKEVLAVCQFLQERDDARASKVLERIQKERGYLPEQFGVLGCGGVDYRLWLFKDEKMLASGEGLDDEN